jgi:hypothetical protein
MPEGTIETKSAKRVWRSRGQLLAGVGSGLFVAFLGLGQFSRPTNGGPGFAVFMFVLAACEIVIFARAALVTSDAGIRIRNPLSTVVIGWDEVDGFRIGRRGVLSAVCIVDLTDGSSRSAFGIQVPRARATARSKEQQIIDQLNELVASHRNSPRRRVVA